jgi:hypothetical protein
LLTVDPTPATPAQPTDGTVIDFWVQRMRRMRAEEWRRDCIPELGHHPDDEPGR